MNKKQPANNTPRRALPVATWILLSAVLVGCCGSVLASTETAKESPAACVEAALGAVDQALAEDAAAREVYNEAVACLVALWQERGEAGLAEPLVLSIGGEELRVETLPGSVSLLDPAAWDGFLPAAARGEAGLHRYVEEGLGAPLIATRENLRAAGSLDRFRPAEGIFDPATAVLIPPAEGASPRVARLALYDRWKVDELRYDGRDIHLAADFTAPSAALLERAESAPTHRGLVLLEPYDPLQIPVLMVHGAASSRSARMELPNAIHGDPVLRGAYQVHHFVGSTDEASADRGLRRALDEIRAALDPKGGDPAFGAMVVIVHGGGEPSTEAAADSDDPIWETVARVPATAHAMAKDGVSTKDGALLREILAFPPRFGVERTIFVAAPGDGGASAPPSAETVDEILRLLREHLEKRGGQFLVGQ